MVDKKLKIAVYSGEIPSTIFIERLIQGLADDGQHVYLFGYQVKKKKYGNPIQVVSYSENRIQKFLQLVKYSTLLFLFKGDEKKQLDTFIYEHHPHKKLMSKLKYYPVLWNKPDIFHLQWAKSIHDWIWLQQFGIKIVVSLRGTHITSSPKNDKKLFNLYQHNFPNVDAFHAVSKDILQKASVYGVDSGKTHVVYSGLMLQPFVVYDKKVKSSITIISVGRNHWVKGYDYALQSCKLLKDKGIAFTYEIVGGGNSEELLFLQHAYGLQKEVQLTGLLPFDKVQQKISAADVLLLPSVEEGIANVVLEAMAIGTLVISTACGGMGEVIINKENGFLVPIRDPDAIAEAIIQVKNLTKESYTHMVTQARTTIEQQHTEKQMVSGMLALYNEVLQS